MDEGAVRDNEAEVDAGSAEAGNGVGGNGLAQGRDRRANIHERILAVTAEVSSFIKKRGVVEIKGREAYDYVTHDDVTLHVRRACIRHGIMVRPNVINHELHGNMTILTVEVMFINVDSPGDYLTVTVVGHGADGSDKGPGKAMSYAIKYAYLKTFMLQSADDIEMEDVKFDPPTPTASMQRDARVKDIEDLEERAKSLKAAIKGAGTAKEVNDLMTGAKGWLMEAPTVTREHFAEFSDQRKKEMVK